MRKTEVYQIRLDAKEKQQAFEVFKQLGLTPAQAVRLFFKQVVLTQSIPFQIEHKAPIALNPSLNSQIKDDIDQDDNYQDIFSELDKILNTQK